MKPTLKKNGSAKGVSRSPAKAIALGKTRNGPAQKSAISEGILLAPSRSRGTEAAVLLFDEADAEFGKRTVVRDSHGRYAILTPDSLVQNPEKRTNKIALNKRKAKKKNVP
ncbi:MAG: hypothetical protein ABI273_01580 [Lacunisphaera sp.]